MSVIVGRSACWVSMVLALALLFVLLLASPAQAPALKTPAAHHTKDVAP
ncbi:hypothetical protein [Streptomyces sp. NPDC057939]